MRDQIYLQTSKKSKFYDDLSHKENPIITFFYTKQEFVPHAGIKSILKTNIPCYNITVRNEIGTPCQYLLIVLY